MTDQPDPQLSRPDGSLADRISATLRRAIEEGEFRPGDRLPGEIDLTRIHSVSRTVVREAIAALRSEGLVDVRRGAGVFVLDRTTRPGRAFDNLATDRITSLIELLELRTACEVEAAAFAAVRRSPTQLGEIYDAHTEVEACLRNGQPTRDADFRFHLAIANATQNRRFPEFLEMIRSGIISRGNAAGGVQVPRHKDYNRHLLDEHRRILDAILEGDAEAARNRMRDHLQGSLARYQEMLRGGPAQNAG